MFTLVISLIVVGWVAAALIGTQAYYLGEQSKPIHERNWDSDGFERIAKLVTGRETNYNERVASYGGDAFTSATLDS